MTNVNPEKPEKRVSPSVKRVLDQQNRDAERETQRSTALVPNDSRSAVDQYLDEVAPQNVVGRLIKFNVKDKCFHYSDNPEVKLSEDTVYTALCGEVVVGWVRFFGKGVPPERHVGLLYDGFVMPPRSSLPDWEDRSKWEIGLDGKETDPYQHHMYVVLQGAAGEFYTYGANNETSRRAVGVLLRHYQRMQRLEPGYVPLIQLRVGGFMHRDKRVGWVSTPVLEPVGRRKLGLGERKTGLSPRAPIDDATLFDPPDDGVPPVGDAA
jgi:hypothetical protein